MPFSIRISFAISPKARRAGQSETVEFAQEPFPFPVHPAVKLGPLVTEQGRDVARRRPDVILVRELDRRLQSQSFLFRRYYIVHIIFVVGRA